MCFLRHPPVNSKKQWFLLPYTASLILMDIPGFKEKFLYVIWNRYKSEFSSRMFSDRLQSRIQYGRLILKKYDRNFEMLLLKIIIGSLMWSKLTLSLLIVNVYNVIYVYNDFILHKHIKFLITFCYFINSKQDMNELKTVKKNYVHMDNSFSTTPWILKKKFMILPD